MAAQPRVHTAGGFIPADKRCSDRRLLRREERALQSASARVAAEQRATAAAAQKAAGEVGPHLPPGGDRGPAALRSYRRFRVEPHRATSAALCGAYPFLTEGGLGAEGVLVGRDLHSRASFCFDPWVLYGRRIISNPNVLLAGVLGVGKSTLAKGLTTRSIAFGRKVYVPGDPKGEWTRVSRAVGGAAIALGQGLPARLNPLDEGPRPAGMGDDDFVRVVANRRRALLGILAETVLGRPIAPTEHSALDAALHTACAGASTPTLRRVVEALLDPTDRADVWLGTAAQRKEDARHVGHGLRRLVYGDLGGLFDGESTVRFDPSLPMVSVDQSRITGNDELLGLVMTCTAFWMEAAVLDPAAGPRWIVYDEGWRMMRALALIRRMQAQWKLAREFGIANLIIVHRLSDFDAVGEHGSEARQLAHGLLADCSTRIIYRQESDQLASTTAALALSRPERELLGALRRGVGLWRIEQRAYVVEQQLSAAERELFFTDARMRA